MRTYVSMVLAAALTSGVMLAQLQNANKKGSMAGHHIFSVKDAESTKQFWRALGGKDVEWGVLKMIELPGAFLYINNTKGGATPGPGTEGSSIDYMGVKVKDLKAALKAIEPLGYKAMAGADAKQAFVMGPDAVKVHLVEDKKLATQVATDDIHMVAGKGAKEWYAKYFGENIGGLRLTFTESATNAAPTKGRAFGTMGIEVKDLAATVAALKDSGATNISDVRQGGKNFPDPFAVAVFTDPWGTTVEMSQGLNQIK